MKEKRSVYLGSVYTSGSRFHKNDTAFSQSLKQENIKPHYFISIIETVKILDEIINGHNFGCHAIQSFAFNNSDLHHGKLHPHLYRSI